jgi:hypothetical protein
MADTSKRATVARSEELDQDADDASPALFAAVHRSTLTLAALSLFAVSTAAFLLTQHLAHTLAYLPYLLLAACPLMHFFHHGRHR